MIRDSWFVVRVRRLVIGHWSLVIGHWSLVIGLAYLWVAFAAVIFLWADSLLGSGKGGEFLARAFLSPRNVRLLATTAEVGGAAAIVALALGIPFAVRLCCFQGRSLPVLTALLFAALTIPPYITAIIWLRLLPPSVRLNTPLGAGAVIGLSFLPLVVLIVSAALKAVPQEVIDDARTHADSRAVVWRLWLPLVSPSIIGAAALVFLLALLEFGTADFLQVKTLTFEIFYLFDGEYNVPQAVATSGWLLLTAMLVFAVFWRWLRRYLAEPGVAQSARPLSSQGVGAAISRDIFCGLVVLLTTGMPVLVLLPHGAQALAPMLLVASADLAHSVLWGGIAAALLVLLLLPIAFAARGAGSPAYALPMPTAWECALVLPVAVPGIVFGIGLIQLYNRQAFASLYDSPAVTVLGLMARTAALAAVPLMLSVRQIDQEQVESAALDGAGMAAALRHIICPQITRYLAAAWLISFAFAVQELPTTLLVRPPGTDTITTRLFQLIHYGHTPDVSALCLMMMTVGMLAFVGVQALLHRQAPSRRSGILPDAGLEAPPTRRQGHEQ